MGDRLAEAVRQWFEKAPVLQTPVALLFGTLYTSELPREFEFLALTQALETFHRRVDGGRFLPEPEYAAIGERLIAAIPDGTPSDLRQALRSRIRYGNEYSQSRRFRELLRSLDADSRLLVVREDVPFVVELRDGGPGWKVKR